MTSQTWLLQVLDTLTTEMSRREDPILVASFLIEYTKRHMRGRIGPKNESLTIAWQWMRKHKVRIQSIKKQRTFEGETTYLEREMLSDCARLRKLGRYVDLFLDS